MSNFISRRAAMLSTALVAGALAIPITTLTLSTSAAAAEPVIDEIILFSEVDIMPVNLASKIMDSDAYMTNGDKIGEVSDIALDDAGSPVALSVGVGGFLGIDETYVAIPMDRVSFEHDGENLKVIADITKQQLEAATKDS